MKGMMWTTGSIGSCEQKTCWSMPESSSAQYVLALVAVSRSSCGSYTLRDEFSPMQRMGGHGPSTIGKWFQIQCLECKFMRSTRHRKWHHWNISHVDIMVTKGNLLSGKKLIGGTKTKCGTISFQVFHFSTITYRYAWLVWDPHQNNGKNSWNSGIFGAWWNHICNHQTHWLVTRCFTLPIKSQSLRSSVNKNLQLPRCFIHPTTFEHSSIQFLGKLVPKPEFKGILVGFLY